MNQFYNHTDGVPAAQSRGSTPLIRNEFDLIQAGFDKLPTPAQLAASSNGYAADTGAANAYVITLSPAPAAYSAGMEISFIAAHSNTGASQVNANTLGWVPLVRPDDSVLLPNDIVAGMVITAKNDGTNFQVQSITPAAVASAATSATAAAASAAAAIASPVAAPTHAATLTTPVDADEFPMTDSLGSWGLVKVTWASIKSTLYSALGALIAAGTGKTTPVGADVLAIGDSAASNATKTLTLTNLAAYLMTALSFAPVSRSLNKFANSCCMVAQRSALTVSLTTARLVGQVDNCAFWCSTGAVSAGTLTQLATGALAGGTGFAARAAGVTLTGGGVLSFAVRMEARDAKKFKNQTCSFQISVDHDVGSNINYTIIAKKVTTTDDVFSALTTISTSSATAVVTATGTLLTFNAIAMGDCSHGIEFEVQAACGNVTTKNFNFTEWSLDIGSVAPTFNGNPYEVDLAMCQRYLPGYFAVSGTFNALCAGSVTSTTTEAQGSLHFPVMTRVVPTGILASTPANFSFLCGSVLSAAAGIVFGVNGTSVVGSTSLGIFTLTGLSASSAGQSGCIYRSSSNPYLLFTGAELF